MSSWYKIYGQYMVPPNPASPDLPTPTQEVYQSAMSATRAAVEGGHALLPGLGTKQAAEATLGVPGATYPHPYTMQEAAQYSGTDAANFCGPDYVYTGNHPLLASTEPAPYRRCCGSGSWGTADTTWVELV